MCFTVEHYTGSAATTQIRGMCAGAAPAVPHDAEGCRHWDWGSFIPAVNQTLSQRDSKHS